MPGGAEEHGAQTPQVGGKCSEGQQGVHADGVVFSVGNGGAVEEPAGIEHDDRAKSEAYPLPAGELCTGRHGDNHDGDGENCRHNKASYEIPVSALFRCNNLFIGVGSRDSVPVGEKTGIVASTFHRINKVLRTVAIGSVK